MKQVILEAAMPQPDGVVHLRFGIVDESGRRTVHRVPIEPSCDVARKIEEVSANIALQLSAAPIDRTTATAIKSACDRARTPENVQRYRERWNRD